VSSERKQLCHLQARNRFYADSIERFGRSDFAPLFSNNAELQISALTYFKKFNLIVSYLKDKDETFLNNLKKIGIKNIVPIDPLPPLTGDKLLNHSSLNSPCKHINMIDYLLEPVISLGIDVKTTELNPVVYLSEDDVSFASDFFNEKGLKSNENDKVVAIHPGSGSKRKNWPVAKFIDTANCLTEKLSCKFIIVCGPADDTIVSALNSQVLSDDIHIVNNLPLLKLAAILKRVDCYLGNDSGISHLASAVQVPSVLIFGPTNPDIWAPRGEHVKIVKSNSLCTVCVENGMQDCQSQDCLESIRVEDVVNEILSLV